MKVSGFFVNKPILNMYASPSEDGEVISQVLIGEKVEILKYKEDFFKVRTWDNYEGYVKNDSIVYSENINRIVVIKENFVNAYVEPSVKKRVMYTLPVASVLIDGETIINNYRLVKDFLGTVFYIQENTFISSSPSFFYPKGDCKNILRTAIQFLNVPYFWGGKSPFGFDCSGFVQTVFRLNGYNLKRDAYMQAEMDIFESVDIQNIKPCDLIFFGQNRIDHVGIYIGSNKFIHATTFHVPKVQISELNVYWITKISVIRRLKW